MPDIIERNAKCARQLLEAGAEIERLRKELREILHLAKASIDDADGCDWLPQIERAASRALDARNG